MPRVRNKRSGTWFQQQRAEIVDALTAAGARFVVLRPRLTAGVLDIEVDARPENLARVERAMRTRDERWVGLATRLADRPGEQISAAGFGNLIARSMQKATRPSADSSALLAAILASPDDDAPRLVLADWLLERGDPHGELIAMQCQLAKAPEAAVAARVRQLLAEHWKKLAGELAPYCNESSFERGFVTTVTIKIAAFVRVGEALVASQPVRRVRIQDPKWSPRSLATLARAPALDRVRELELTGAGQARPIGALGASHYLGSLRALSVSGAGVSAADWTAFAGLTAPLLEELQIWFSRSSLALFEALGRSRRLPRLRSFHQVHSGWIGRPTSRAIQKAVGHLAQLGSLERVLFHGHNEVRDGAIAAFFDPSTPASLRELELVGSPVTDQLVPLITRSPKAARLESLRLHGSQLSLGGIRKLLEELPNLRLAGFDQRPDHPEYDRIESVLLALPTSHPLRVVDTWIRQPSPALCERYQINRR